MIYFHLIVFPSSIFFVFRAAPLKKGGGQHRKLIECMAKLAFSEIMINFKTADSLFLCKYVWIVSLSTEF